MPDPIPIDDQVACVKRELQLRRKVYPRWVDAGKMPPRKARYEIDAMEAVLATLERVRDEQRPGLFR